MLNCLHFWVRVRVRVRLGLGLGVLGPTIEAKSDCGCARSLNSFWPPILRSQRPKKNVSLLMQKIQKRVQMARVVFNKVCTANSGC